MAFHTQRSSRVALHAPGTLEWLSMPMDLWDVSPCLVELWNGSSTLEQFPCGHGISRIRFSQLDASGWDFPACEDSKASPVAW